MLKNSLLDKLTYAQSNIRIRPSRCLRMRYSENRCTECSDACRFGAITIDDEGIEINEDKCTGCLLCSASCITGSIAPQGFSFSRLLNGLLGVSSPVLGCSVTSEMANVTAPCLGFLSEECLLAIYGLTGKRVTINLSCCKQCYGEVIIEELSKKLLQSSYKSGINLREFLILATNKEEVKYSAPEVSRRGFFKALRDITLHGASDIFKTDSKGIEDDSYASKAIPEPRILLNRALQVLGDKDIVDRIVQHYFYTFTASSLCVDCQSCIGMCPTGALIIQGGDILFNPSLCTGCNLCVDFCIHKTGEINKGYYGMNPLLHDTAPIKHDNSNHSNIYLS